MAERLLAAVRHLATSIYGWDEVNEVEEGLARCTDLRDAHFSKFQLVFNN